MLNERNHVLLDINMGCPVPKIVRNGEGSALMRDPDLAQRVVEAAVSASTKPVTVKIRAGWNDAEKNAVEVARAIEAGGASAVAVHGRTREQFYSGNADWDIIAAVKDVVRIPVIGNGDVTDVTAGDLYFSRSCSVYNRLFWFYLALFPWKVVRLPFPRQANVHLHTGC